MHNASIESKTCLKNFYGKKKKGRYINWVRDLQFMHNAAVSNILNGHDTEAEYKELGV